MPGRASLAPVLVSKEKAQQAGHWTNIPGFGAD